LLYLIELAELEREGVEMNKKELEERLVVSEVQVIRETKKKLEIANEHQHQVCLVSQVSCYASYFPTYCEAYAFFMEERRNEGLALEQKIIRQKELMELASEKYEQVEGLL